MEKKGKEGTNNWAKAEGVVQQWFAVNEAAAYLGREEDAIGRYVQLGCLNCYRIRGRGSRRFKLADLQSLRSYLEHVAGG